MSSQHLERGFHIIEVSIAVVVVVAIALGGYGVYHHNHNKNTVSTKVPAAPQIKNSKDLDTATKTINDISTSTADLDNLEKELNSL